MTLRCRLGALPPVGGASQVDVGRVWTLCLPLWFSEQALLLNEQLQAGIAGSNAHLSANALGSSGQPHARMVSVLITVLVSAMFVLPHWQTGGVGLGGTPILCANIKKHVLYEG